MNNTQELSPSKQNTLSSLRVLIVILALLALGGGSAFYGLTTRSQTPNQPASPFLPSPTTASKAFSLPPSSSTATLIYGVWEEGRSVIKAVNADGSNHVTIAKLPSNIKDVNVISDRELLYIADTDNRDHGKKVNIYNLVTGQTSTLFEASTGFGIDDIVLSPDKKWLATWEVKFAPNSNILEGGSSRVYTVNILQPTNKTLITEEQNVSATNFLRYPLFFNSQNRLFLDTFGPNGGGWNRGLWVVNNDGSNLMAVPGMADGDYSIDPLISPDGTKIVFTGYDPTATVQLFSQTSGILRPAIANPNLLQVMDLTTFQKTTLLGSADGAQYANPLWSETQDKIVFQKFKVLGSNNSEYEGTFVHDLTISATTQVAALDKTYPLEILEFKRGDLLVGKPSQNTGNLGKNYASAYEDFTLVQDSYSSSKTLVLGTSLQFINYISKNPQTVSALNISSQMAQELTPKTLKLKSFEIKQIAQVRNPQQNDSPGLPHCHDLLGYDKQKEWAAARKEGKCADSPLYLYPQKETLVTIKVKPPAHILYSKPAYHDGWQVLAKPNGQLITKDSNISDKISYNYLTTSIEPPKYGFVVKKEEIRNSLEAYAKNLGLVRNEITDFVSFWSQNLPDSPYFLISHFSEEESRSLLPLEIDPKPDTLIQTVMYFKPLEEPINLPAPIFSATKREGFVAVDWSGIVED